MLTWDVNTVVVGLKDFPRENWPPVLLTFTTFHVMVILGMFFIGFSLLGAFLLWREKLFEARWYLWIAVLSLPLPFVANHAGWGTAEVGRQPWVVYNLLKTADAVSVTVSKGELWFSLIMFAVLYTLLFALWLFLLTRKIQHGPEEVKSA